MLALTYEFKSKPTVKQELEMLRVLTVCRRVWNYALRERKDWSTSRKSPINACSLRGEFILPADQPYPGFAWQCKSLTQARKQNEELRSVNAQVLQQVLRTLDKSFEAMRDLGRGYPRFKKPNRMKSFLFPQLGKDPLRRGMVKLPSLGWVRIRQSRPYPEGFELKQARIVKRASGFYVMLVFKQDVDVPQVEPSGHFVGVDIGLEYFLSTSDSLQVERPQFFCDLQRKLKLLQRRLKRMQKGSSNWVKAHRRIARVHEQIANNRKDFHFKKAHQLCDAGDSIFVENLNLVGLSRGILGKQMLDAGHGQFLNQVLPWVCFKRGKSFQKVNAARTSQECPSCGAIKKKALSERWHRCSCGASMPRDIASAIVIRDRAVGRTVQQNACGDGLAGGAA